MMRAILHSTLKVWNSECMEIAIAGGDLIVYKEIGLLNDRVIV
jgi:hypothetical protein